MNRILESTIKDFTTQFNYHSLKSDAIFERFCCYSIATKEMPQLTVTNEHIEDACIGNGNDWGIDGFLILINKRSVFSVAEVQSYKDMDLKVDIILLQAKTSEKIDCAELGVFLDGVRNVIRFLEDREKRDKLPPMNESLKEKLQILDSLYECASLGSDLDSSRPILKMYYCVGGNNGPTEDHLSLCNSKQNDLNERLLTVGNSCDIIPALNLNKIYKDNRSRIQKTITIDSAITFHSMDGIA